MTGELLRPKTHHNHAILMETPESNTQEIKFMLTRHSAFTFSRRQDAAARFFPFIDFTNYCQSGKSLRVLSNTVTNEKCTI